MVGIIQVYRLVARVEKVSMFSMPCHARRKDSLHYALIRSMQRRRIKPVPFDIEWRGTNYEQNS